jgi:hypothetical protein
MQRDAIGGSGIAVAAPCAAMPLMPIRPSAAPIIRLG